MVLTSAGLLSRGAGKAYTPTLHRNQVNSIQQVGALSLGRSSVVIVLTNIPTIVQSRLLVSA